MTERLYYTDAYLAEFTGRVIDRSEDGQTIYLDRSAFYPTSGGQPNDLGTLGGVRVVDVVDEEERVAHRLAEPLLEDGEVSGRIEWPRRFDFMQQHTGQHLLSAVFSSTAGMRTVSVHFGAESCTVDLDASSIDAETLRRVADHSNAIVFENLPVNVAFEDAAAAEGLRKPTKRTGTIRVITIEGVDRSACGGTHVRRTGEIGPILLRSVEKVKQGTRVEFLCGARATRRARRDYELLQQISQSFSASLDSLPELLERQRAAAKENERDRRRLEEVVSAHRARELHAEAAPDHRGRRLVVERAGSSLEELRMLAQAVAALPGGIFVGALPEPPTLLVAASGDSGFDAGRAVREIVGAHGGRGGGSPVLGQGTVPAGALAHALHDVTRRLDER